MLTRRALTLLSRSLVALLIGTLPAARGIEVGIAVRDVTPDPLLPVSGGIGPSHPTRLKQGDLTVRALVLADADTRVAILSMDFLGFPAILGDRVRARVPEIPSENILIGATHTHSAPDCYGFPDGKGGFSMDPDYLDSVCRRAAEAVHEAFRTRRFARLKIATGEAKGRIAYNYYAEQLYDPRCDVLQAIDAHGAPFATLVNYAIHPEVIGSDAGILSPDLIGPLYDRIAAKGAGTGIFMNGAQGGMVTADNRAPDGTERRDWKECRRIGSLLADEALRIVKDAPTQASPRLDCFSRVVSFPVDSATIRQLFKMSPLHYTPLRNHTISTRINLLNIGNAQVLTIPGEALPNIGYFLKRNMKGEHHFLFGLTNDAFGYILTRVDWGSFKRYDYISKTSLGPMTGAIYINHALSLIAHSPAPHQD